MHSRVYMKLKIIVKNEWQEMDNAEQKQLIEIEVYLHNVNVNETSHSENISLSSRTAFQHNSKTDQMDSECQAMKYRNKGIVLPR